jgi:23S rRNA pseudouridine1911/1915/1917 synthase
MRKIPDEARSEIVDQNHQDAKHAALKYRVVKRTDEASLVEIELLTGRTHQIRLQFSARGHAILGDELYGSSYLFGEQTVDLRKRQIALHSTHLKFRHPIDDEDVEISVSPPEAWERFGGDGETASLLKRVDS